MKKLRISALLTCVAMIATLFAGCGKNNETLVTIDGKAMPRYMFEYFVYSMANSYSSQGMNLGDYLDEDAGDGTTVNDLMKSQIIDTLKTYVACEKLAEENGLALTEEELKGLEETKKQQIEEMGGRKEFAAQLEQAKIQEEAIDDMSRYGAIYQKVLTGLFSEGGKFAPSAEEVISSVLPANIRVKHVLIQATEGSEDYETKKQTAEQVRARAAAGEDFEALIKEFNEDPGMDTYTEGYIFDKDGNNFDGSGTMDATFTAGAFALQVNGVSPVIATSHGFHIIKRLPMDEAYVTEHMSTFITPAADAAFQNKVMEISEGLTVVETEAYKNFSLKDLLSPTTSGDGHDHGSTGTLEDAQQQPITVEPVEEGGEAAAE